MKQNFGPNLPSVKYSRRFTRSLMVVVLAAGWSCAPGLAQGPPDILWTASGHSREVNAVAFSPDGALLASASDDYTVKLWRVADGMLVRTLSGHQQDVQSAAFSPDGTRLYSGGKDSTIRVWRIPDGALLQTIAEDSLAGLSQGQPRHALALSRDGQWIATGRTFWHAASTNWVGWVQVRQATNIERVYDSVFAQHQLAGLGKCWLRTH